MRTVSRTQARKVWRTALHVDCGSNSPRAGGRGWVPGVEETGKKARMGWGGCRWQWVGESCPFIFRVSGSHLGWGQGRVKRLMLWDHRDAEGMGSGSRRGSRETVRAPGAGPSRSSWGLGGGGSEGPSGWTRWWSCWVWGEGGPA